MQSIQMIPAIFSFIAPFSWAMVFFIKLRQSETFRFACISFAGITILMFYGLSLHIRYLPLSRVVFLFYPAALSVVPIFYIFYLHTLTSPFCSVSRPVFLLLLIPAAQFLYSGYAFYISDPNLTEKENFYAAANSLSIFEYRHYNMAYIAHEINAILKLAGLSTMIIVPVLFVPRMMKSDRIHSPYIRQQCTRFVMLLMVTFVVCIASLIYHFIPSWKALMEILWGAGFMYAGYLIYREPECRLALSVPAGNEMADDTSLTTRIIRYFENTKPWQNPELKISEIARALATNRTYISDALRRELKTNFNQFVNHYRIEEAKRLLANGCANVKMTEIAMDTGFNNYTTFYNAFRKETGMSPQEYAGRKKG